MNTRSQTQIKTPLSFTPLRTGVLQRKSNSCGQKMVVGGECAECQKKNTSFLQQRTSKQAQLSEVPPVVHQVLKSPGQPLDSSTRIFMQSRFNHDFTGVRVHTDAEAAKSAKMVNALAYTVGQNVVFGVGQYAPGTGSGRRLLAHELVHTIQQSKLSNNNSLDKIKIGAANDASEGAADLLAEQGLKTKPGDSIAVNNIAPASKLVLQRTCAAHPDESYYRTASNYCKDTGFSGSLHPGQRCYREVPRRSGYWDCPPGDQVCFDANNACHDSYDRVSTVESKNSDGSCNLHAYCFLGHAVQDIVPGLLEESGRRQLECIRSCEELPWYIRGFCMQGCSGTSPMM
ncbi:MAG: DUF4157 domain-containing protein [Calothrix sp. C42_A2020_038]|nr:DUF4157 domain-containing protein [Calothrix sp. C42_A2020_038]